MNRKNEQQAWELDERPDDPPATTRIEHDVPGTPYDEDLPGLERASAERMKGPPVYVEMVHAEILVAQFRETAAYRLPSAAWLQLGDYRAGN